MPRLVASSSPFETFKDAAPPDGPKLEDYLERVAKYVPVEIIGAYMAIRGAFPAHGTEDGLPTAVEIAVYLACLALTPLYLIKLGGDVPGKATQIAIACVSFVVWTYAIGGPFFWGALEAASATRIVYPGLAGALVVLWSLAAGLVKPEGAS